MRETTWNFFVSPRLNFTEIIIMSSFFLPSSSSSSSKVKGRGFKKDKKPKDSRKRKGSRKDDTRKKQKKEEEEDNPQISDDEEIPSDDNEDKFFHTLAINDDLSEGEETAPEKRLRLAKDYLAQLRAEEKQSDDEDDIDSDAIAQRLHDEVLEKSGRLHKKVADQYSTTTHSIKFYKGHKLSVTCLVVTPDDQYVFTGSKDGSIIKWNISTGVKEIIISKTKSDSTAVGHTGHVLALAVSSDGNYLASGGTDNVVYIWNPLTCIHCHTFTGHKGAVSGLVFQYGTHQLFSASFDRTVKVWNLDEMTYVETLFGHQDGVVSIDCLTQERPVTAGIDKTLRVWKVIEESQLVFHGHKSSIDTVKFIDDKNFVSGSQDGVALWNVMKKKPHVIHRHSSATTQMSVEGKDLWVTAVTTLPYTDLVASGSRDGFVQFWKCGESYRSLEQLFTVPVPGFVNCLSFCKEGQYCIAGVGQEHRLGRWWKDTKTKNGIVIITLDKHT